MEKFYVINYDNGDRRAGYFNSGKEVLEYAKSLNVEYEYTIYEYKRVKKNLMKRMCNMDRTLYAMILIMLALSTICYLIGYSVGLGIL